MGKIFAGIFFAAIPAVLLGLAVLNFGTSLNNKAFALVVAGAMFLFGLDMCFRGSGNDNERDKKNEQ